jgi:diguanylate cyclase (GGDEF)-like protein
MENLEKQVIPSEEEIKQINTERARVDKLDMDSIHDLAKEEDKYRDESNDERLRHFSDKSLEAKENEKEKFIDPLTGIGNRGAFNETIPKVLNIEKRENKSSAMLMVDIDFFKQVNDKYGHDAGDKTLIELVNIIKDTIRASDIVFRVGGEEFSVFLPNTDMGGAKVIADKIRGNVEKAKIFDTTVSIGCMSTDELEGESLKEWTKKRGKIDMQKIVSVLKKKSDLALYDAKNKGRNRVTPYSEELEKK